MPQAAVNGLSLYHEETGSGTPLVFLHEFAGDHRSWEPQVRHFARRYRCVTYCARGYPPSDVPADAAHYTQDHQLADLLGLLDHLRIEQAHLCGLSMGANAALFFGLRHPGRVLSMTIAGGGYGAGGNRAEFQHQVELRAQALLRHGMGHLAETYAKGPARVQFINKDRRGWEEFDRQFREHSPQGSAYTLLGVQKTRPNILALGAEMERCGLPALVILGDEDTPGLEGSLYMKRCLPRAGLAMFPKSGHAVNLEEPMLFNRTLSDFLAAVDAGRWEPRDPSAMQGAG
jgi:pimeloyl-ACP methyl ester carboxylesterase